MFFDTHTHLYLPDFGSGSPEISPAHIAVVRRAIDAGVTRMVFPNVDLTTVAPMRQLAAFFPGAVHMAMGLHPTEIGDSWQEDTARILSEFDRPSTQRYVALGEVGIDLYWDKTYERQQILSLEMQLRRAAALSLPVIIHCREGLDQVLEVLQGFPGLKAVFHSFGGTVDDVRRIRRVGDYYFGINGIVTFKNCKVRDALPEITLSRLLLETDAPYLAPVPHRGKRNESAFMVHTAAHIASHLGLQLPDVASATTANALGFFNIAPSSPLDNLDTPDTPDNK